MDLGPRIIGPLRPAGLPDRLEGQFDVVYTSRGVLGWLPDIRGLARVVANFVRPGGIFYITEAHPIAWALDEKLPLTFRYAYWEHSVQDEVPLFYSLRARKPA